MPLRIVCPFALGKILHLMPVTAGQFFEPTTRRRGRGTGEIERAGDRRLFGIPSPAPSCQRATAATARCSRSQSVEFCLVATARWSGFRRQRRARSSGTRIDVQSLFPQQTRSPVLRACARSGRHLRACGLNRHGQPLRQGFSERPALHIQRSDNRWLAVCLFLKPDGVLRLPLRDKYQRLSLHRCLLGLPVYPLAYAASRRVHEGDVHASRQA